jgi:uncharacterized small protein (DUF1192 family)
MTEEKKKVSELYDEVIEKHGKAQEALTKLKTTKELKEKELQTALNLYKEKYGEDLDIDALPERMAALEKEITEAEASLTTKCNEFLTKWDNGGNNAN